LEIAVLVAWLALDVEYLEFLADDGLNKRPLVVALRALSRQRGNGDRIAEASGLRGDVGEADLLLLLVAPKFDRLAPHNLAALLQRGGGGLACIAAMRHGGEDIDGIVGPHDVVG